MAKKTVQREYVNKWGDPIIYKMPRAMAKDLGKGKIPSQIELVNYVNTEFRLVGECVRVDLV